MKTCKLLHAKIVKVTRHRVERLDLHMSLYDLVLLQHSKAEYILSKRIVENTENHFIIHILIVLKGLSHAAECHCFSLMI